ncbi:MAG: malto-oligosyltrehalose trehalohydrolase [Flavisolibacter sp.]
MLSASFQDNRWHFKVWAPQKEKMVLHIVQPFEQSLPMRKDEDGYFSISIDTAEKVLHYFFNPEGVDDFPDPASQFQPEGVHGASQTIDHSSYKWKDGEWNGLPLSEMIIYELHVGLFTPEGSFEGIIPRLDELRQTGINAIELMPVSQFPGDRNWGYDGTFPYAVQNSYGGPEGLKKLVDACHEKGVAVIVDVVYNHLGPEGNHFSQFGPYFTNKYHTPWGDAINFDGEWSDGVRDYFSDNVIHWFEHYHIDGLRCDAIHAVYDTGAVHFWELTHKKVKKLEQKKGRPFFIIAESDLNSPKVVKSPEQGGYGFDAQWLDDFHHALYVLINPPDKERYYDFGKVSQLVKAFNEGFVHSGQWVEVRKRKHGASSAGVPGDKFIVFNQNHDQIGNRADGKRLCMLVDDERMKLAAAAILLAPYIPMLFMGEEYADQSPFFYFVSHSNKELIKAVQEGRSKEFEDFGFDQNIPDPQDENTFLQCKLNWGKRNTGHHQTVLNWHKELIRMRRTLQPLRNFDKQSVDARAINDHAFLLFRHATQTKETITCFFNFSEEGATYNPSLQCPLVKILDSREERWSTEKKGNTELYKDKIEANGSIYLHPLSVAVYSSAE